MRRQRPVGVNEDEGRSERASSQQQDSGGGSGVIFASQTKSFAREPAIRFVWRLQVEFLATRPRFALGREAGRREFRLFWLPRLSQER